ncbi:MAG: hypothetical protein COA58_04705 [Bacteroidetes bacterium]|nr:MAG: hypothetical protein COA58_04705 [Bacteroidota bacterium]
MEVSIIITLIIFGMLGGFLSGLLGVGGGIIFVPIISSVLVGFGLQDPDLAKYILANSFAATFFAGAISSYKQYKLNSFYPKQILLTATLAIPSSLLLTHFIAIGNWYNKETYGLFFIGLLVVMLIRFLTSTKSGELSLSEVKNSRFPITGALTGIVAALSGLGGGVIMVPLFTQFVNLNIKKAATISIGVIPIMMVPMILSYGSHTPVEVFSERQIGYLVPEIFMPLIAGLLFTAPLGVSVAQKSSPKLLKIIFASLILIVIIKTIVSIL